MGSPATHRTTRLLAAILLACTLCACGAGASPQAGGSGSRAVDPVADPTQNVLSSITVDPALRTELPASIQRGGTVLLATTDRPGTAGLPIAGTDARGAAIGVEIDIR